MKTKNILAALVLLLVCASTCTILISCSKDDTEENGPSGTSSNGSANSHKYVDLGLPSGTLWATCNVGASKPEEYGDYFAWGETKPKSEYSKETYVFFGGYKSGNRIVLMKYCTNNNYGPVDNKNILEPEDDAATANWGEGWKTPSPTQLEELIDENNTTTEHTSINSVNGLKITSRRNGESVFLPAAGAYRYDSDSGSSKLYGEGTRGYYLSRMIASRNTEVIMLFSHSIDVNYDTSRWDGQSVRPVREK